MVCPRRLEQRAENTPLSIIQPVAELHVQAAQRIDGALSIEQTGSAHLRAAIAGQNAVSVVPAPASVRESA